MHGCFLQQMTRIGVVYCQNAHYRHSVRRIHRTTARLADLLAPTTFLFTWRTLAEMVASQLSTRI